MNNKNLKFLLVSGLVLNATVLVAASTETEARKKTHDAVDRVSHAASDAKDKAKHVASDVADKAKHVASDVKDAAKGFAKGLDDKAHGK